jgi:hypothetical protein
MNSFGILIDFREAKLDFVEEKHRGSGERPVVRDRVNPNPSFRLNDGFWAKNDRLTS